MPARSLGPARSDGQAYNVGMSALVSGTRLFPGRPHRPLWPGGIASYHWHSPGVALAGDRNITGTYWKSQGNSKSARDVPAVLARSLTIVNCDIDVITVLYRKFEVEWSCMSENYFSTSDLSRKSGDVIAEALRRPVTITQRNKPRLVLLNYADYQKLIALKDTRQAGLTRDMPEELVQEIENALDDFENDAP